MDTKSNVDELNTSSNDTCLICCYPISIYSYGKCLHYICHKCQMRIRVLCDQQECPVCRTSLQKVIISHNYNPSEVEYLEKSDETETNLPKWGIYFDSQAIKDECMRLLNDICIICAKKTDSPKVYSNIMGLKLHLQVVHEKYFCEICLNHLKLFTSERAIYTSSELAQHLEGNYTTKTTPAIKPTFDNKSTPNNQSITTNENNGEIQQSTTVNFIDSGYKGHPACLFCMQKLTSNKGDGGVTLFSARFLDQEELYKHLRRDHFFCHFCDVEGRNRYFDTYPILRDHFRAEHFLCEEGECKHERFTTAFRNEIEYKHHMLEQHSRGMDKQSQRLLRAVDLLVINNNNHQATNNLADSNAIFNMHNINDNISSGYRFPTEPSSIYTTNDDGDNVSNLNVNNRNRNRGGGIHSRGRPNSNFINQNNRSGPRNANNVEGNNFSLSGEQTGNFINTNATGRQKRPFFAQGTLLPTSNASTNLNQSSTNNTGLNNNQSQQQDVTYLAGGIGTGTIEFYNSNLSNDYDENGFENGFYRRYQMTDQDFPTIAKSNPPHINGNNSNFAINMVSTQQQPNKKADSKVQQIQTNASSIGNSRAPFLPKSYNLTTDNVSATWSNTAKNYHLNDPNAFPSLPKASVPNTKKTSQPITLPSKTKNSSLTCTSSAQNHHAISIYTKPVKSSKQSTNNSSGQSQKQKQTSRSTALAPSNVKSDSFETSTTASNSITGKSKYNPRKDPNFDSSDGEDWQTNNPSSSSSLAQQFAFNVRDSTVRFSTDDTKKSYAAKIKTMNHPSYRNEFHGLPIIRPDNLIDTPEDTFKAMGTGTTTMVRDATLSTLNFPTLLSSGMKNNPKNNQENGKTPFATSFSNVISASCSNSKSSHRSNQGRLLLPPPPITLQPNNPSSSNDYTWDLSENVSVEQHFPTLKNNGDLVSQNHLPLINDERIPTHEDKKGIRSNAKLKRQKDEDRMLDLIKRLNEKTALKN